MKRPKQVRDWRSSEFQFLIHSMKFPSPKEQTAPSCGCYEDPNEDCDADTVPNMQRPQPRQAWPPSVQQDTTGTMIRIFISPISQLPTQPSKQANEQTTVANLWHKQTSRQTDRQTGKQANKQTERINKQTNNQTSKQANKTNRTTVSPWRSNQAHICLQPTCASSENTANYMWQLQNSIKNMQQINVSLFVYVYDTNMLQKNSCRCESKIVMCKLPLCFALQVSRSH